MKSIPTPLLLTVAIPLIAFVVTRRGHTLRCDELLRRLHPYQQRGRDHLLEGDTPVDFWDQTDGYRGLLYRWQNRKVFLGLCQIRIQQNGLKCEHLRYITERCAKLTAITALLLLLYPFRKLRLVLKLGNLSYRLYSQIADRTHSYFALDDEPVCSLRIASLL